MIPFMRGKYIDSRLVAAWKWGEDGMGVTANGYVVSFWNTENVLK